MKNFFKGCLWIVVSIAFLVLGIVIYSNLPNKINFESEPLTFKEYENRIYCVGHKIPKYIKGAKKEDILYQAMLVRTDWEQEFIFKQIIKLKKKIKLDKKLPIKQKDLNKIKKNSFFAEIYENTIFKIPKNKKTHNSKTLQIYSTNKNIKLNLKKGSYSIYYDEIDKVGVLAEIIIYDEKNQLLYFARTRYHPFQ